MKTLKRSAVLLTVALMIISAVKVTAGTIYDNSTSDLNARFTPGTFEVGDEIILSSADASRFLTTFSFEYYGTNTANPVAFSGNVQARLRFYLNDGTPFNGYATPGTVPLYDSGFFALGVTPLGRATVNFTEGVDWAFHSLFLGPGPGGTLLTNMTWSIQFSGMGATDQIGLDLYNPPLVGGNYSDYWENNGGWMLQTNVLPINFAAKMDATPEPSPIVLSVFGGLGLLALRYWFLKKK
jgi:hypothetical protein